MNCLFCNKVPNMLKTSDPFLVYEFQHSVLMMGEHQILPGYCVLVLKDHAVELFDLKPSVQTELTHELSKASQALSKAFNTDKINISSYGNIVPHLHWHIFPRHTSDLAWPNPPWAVMDKFKDYKTSPEAARSAALKIRQHL